MEPPLAPRYGRPVQARATVRGVLVLQVLANGAGAALVVAYLSLLIPASTPTGAREVGINLIVFGIYLTVTVLVAVPVNAVILARGVNWVREGRDPSFMERVNTLGLPLSQTISAFVVWIGAAIAFGVLNEDRGRVSLGIALAGLVTCVLLYQLLDRHFRPIFALALVDAPLPRRWREIQPRLMLAWLLGSAVPLISIGLVPIALPDGELADSGVRITVLVVSGVVAGGFIMRAAARSVAVPVDEVRRAMYRVEDGDLDVQLPVTNIGEIGRLQLGFNGMVAGLRERRRIEDLFGRQVGADVAREALGRDPELGGEEREVTVLFVDLEGFTAFTEQHSPAEVVDELNRFFGAVLREVMRQGGWVNKFEGDAALCIFGAPADQPDHAARALRAAATLPRVLSELPDAPRAGIGVATGTAIAGHIGTPERYEYTVIGDTVNVASRLTDLAKQRHGRVLATAATVEAAGQAARDWVEAGSLSVKGRRAPLDVFELPDED